MRKWLHSPSWIAFLTTVIVWIVADFVQPKIVFQSGERSYYGLRRVQCCWVTGTRLCAIAGRNRFGITWERIGNAAEEPFLSFVNDRDRWSLVMPVFIIYREDSYRPDDSNQIMAQRYVTLSVGVPYWMPAAALLLYAAGRRWHHRREAGRGGFPLHNDLAHLRSSALLVDAKRRGHA